MEASISAFSNQQLEEMFVFKEKAFALLIFFLNLFLDLLTFATFYLFLIVFDEISFFYHNVWKVAHLQRPS